MGLVKIFKNLIIDKEIKEKLKFLKTYPIFTNLEYHEITKVYNIMFSKNYLPNDIIFEEGKIGKAIFFVYSGKVGIIKNVSTKKEHEIAELHSGEFFGEMALLEELPRSGSAKAIEKTQVYLIYKANFDGLLEMHPQIGLKIIRNLVKIMSMRLRNLSACLVKDTEGDSQ